MDNIREILVTYRKSKNLVLTQKFCYYFSSYFESLSDKEKFKEMKKDLINISDNIISISIPITKWKVLK